MSALLPAMVYGLEIPPGDVMVPAVGDFPAAFRITMAAIDPSASPEFTGNTAPDASPRATLKIIRQVLGPEDDEDDEDLDSDEGSQLLLVMDSEDSEEEDDSDDEEKNGGPSDPAKSKKAQRAAAAEALQKALLNGGDDRDMSVEDDGLGKINKGKGKATESDEENSEDDEDLGIEEFVICTLDPVKMYQQPLDITIGEDERVFFKVSGTHTIYLTGNFVMPVDDTHNHMGDDSEEDEYDLSPDEDELDLLNEEESDDLDNMEDPRLVEVESEEEEAPKLVKKGKGKNKRAAEESEEEAGLDEIMTKALKKGSEAATNGEAKLSKKQLKKLKNNAGEAAAAALENKNVKKVDATSSDSPNKEKKVQFAKNLEQGPTGKDVKAPKDAKMNGDKGARKADEAKPKVDKTDNKADSAHGKTILGVKTIQGVTLDDRKIGTGPAAKKGAKVGLRYIGKTDDGKQFDANKKGKPFTFTLGAGEVIKGWDIGVEGMSVGGERRLTIPANLAYGNKALPGIPKNSRLTFDIKVLHID